MVLGLSPLGAEGERPCHIGSESYCLSLNQFVLLYCRPQAQFSRHSVEGSSIPARLWCGLLDVYRFRAQKWVYYCPQITLNISYNLSYFFSFMIINYLLYESGFLAFLAEMYISPQIFPFSSHLKQNRNSIWAEFY